MSQNPLIVRPSSSLLGARNDSREIWAVCLCCVVTTSAVAATPKIEEVIVSARKVEERLQDVPISVTAITGEQLRAQGAVDIKDVLRLVPGLAYDSQDRAKSTYSIRGLASGPTTTGVYLDDISLLVPSFGGGGVGAGSTDPVFLDMERVEVLKGPQGTLYGGSAMGGAIKYVSARPDLSETAFRAATGVATTAHGSESYNAEGVVNVPVVQGALAFRGGFYFNHEGGYIDNVANLPVENPGLSTSPFPTYTPSSDPSLSQENERDFNDSNTFAARASLLFQPDDTFSIRPFVFYQDYKLDNPSEYFTNVSGLDASYRFATQEQVDRIAIYGLDINKRFGDVDFTSLTGYFDRKSARDRDYSYFVNRALGLPFATNSFAYFRDANSTFSQEFRLASAPGGVSPLSWLTGIYYSHKELQSDPEIRVFSPSFPNLLLDGDTHLDNKEYAAFGEVTYSPFDVLELTAGVRVFKFDYHNVNKSIGLVAGVQSDLKFSENGVSPKFVAAFKPNPDDMLYASAAKGFRSGGPINQLGFRSACDVDFAALGLDGAPAGYDSDSVWTYEIGSKNMLAGGNVVLNGALFQTDWSDIQQTLFLPTCGSGFQANAGAARIRGAELETNISIFPSFAFGGTLSYLDAEITDPGKFGNTFGKGDDIQSAPEWMVSVYGEFRKDLSGDWGMQLRADYQYRSNSRLSYSEDLRVIYSDGVAGFVPNTAERNPGYDVANINLTFDNRETSVRLFARNLFDSQPVLDRQNTILFHTRASTLRPRTIGLEIGQQF